MTNLHKQMFQAWNAREFDVFGSILHPDYTYTGGDGKEHSGGPQVGEAIAQMYATAFPDATITIDKLYEVEGVSICEFVARGTHGGELMGIPATGKPVDIRVCNVIEIREGKVYREREYMDMAAMMAQIQA